MKKLFYLVALTTLMACNQAPKISQWRGENRSGIYHETNLLKNWGENGPDLVWETEGLGDGYSSPIITDEFIYVTGAIDSIGNLFKFDLNGQKLWQVTYGKEWTTNFPGSRGTPTVVDDKIYLCSGLGDIFCIGTENGDVIWHKSMPDDFGGINPRFGYSQALEVNGDLIYCEPGGAQNNVIALNRNTGQLIWKNKYFGEHPAYNSPNLIQLKNKTILVTFSAYHLLGIDAESGQLLWSHEQTNTKPEDHKPGVGDTHGNTILFDDGFIYYSAADGNGGVKLKLSNDGNSISEVWETPNFDNFMGGFIKLNDKLFTGSHRKQQLIAINCNTSEPTDSLKLGRGITLAADGLIYYYSDKGIVSLIKPGTEGMQVVNSFKLSKGTKEHFTHPVIRDGKLYLRHGNYLGVYNLKKED